jgi:hypothetical protein
LFWNVSHEEIFLRERFVWTKRVSILTLPKWQPNVSEAGPCPISAKYISEADWYKFVKSSDVQY